MTEKGDRDLIVLANQGDADAMTQLYYRHRDWVLALAMTFCRNQTDAEDAAQEVFKYFFNKFPGFTLTCELKTFLYPVVRNKSVDILRRKKRHETIEADFREEGESVGENSSDSSRNVIELAATLPEPQQDVVVLRFVYALSVPEISERLGIPQGTVKSRLHHALRVLRSSFSE